MRGQERGRTAEESPKRKQGGRRLSWEELSQAFRPCVPFTALNTVWRYLDGEAKSILDVGCGRGRPMAFLNRNRRLLAVGVDAFFPYLQEARALGVYAALVLADARNLPFRPQSFDVVLMMEVLEHLDRPDGVALLAAAEEIAIRQVIITTPVGHYEQHEYDGNPLQEHRHIWEPGQLRALGYRVYGHGLRNLGGLSGVQSPLPRALRPLVDVLWVAAGLVTRRRPDWAGNVVAVKRLV